MLRGSILLFILFVRTNFLGLNLQFFYSARIFSILARIRKVQRAVLRHSQQALNLRQAGLALKRGAKVGNRLGGTALKEQEHTQVPLRLHIIRVERRQCLKFRYSKAGLLLALVLLSLSTVLLNLRLLVIGSLRETQSRAQKQADPGERDGSLYDIENGWPERCTQKQGRQQAMLLSPQG